MLGATSSAACSFVLQIFQFKSQYLLSEISVEIHHRMSLAVANVLVVNVTYVVITFLSALFDRRSVQTGVLVSVGITEYQDSAASYASRVTQDKFNKEMAAMGLKAGQLIVTGV